MTTEERTAWLADRQTGLGGTDMASICGVGFQDAAAVYAEKVAPEPIDRPPTILMRLGLASEDFNAQLYAERTGARLLAPGLMRAEPEPWAFATYDRVRVDSPVTVGCPVELKWTPFFRDSWGPDGTDEVRDGYLVQAVWEAVILRLNGHDVRRTDLSVLSGTGEHRIYPIPFDEQFGAMLLEIGRAFWGRVVTRAGADGWRHPLLADVEKRLTFIKPDATVTVGPDEVAIVEEIDGLTLVKKQGEEAEERIKLLKSQLVERLAPAQIGTLPDGRQIKLYPVAGKVVTPAPYELQPRTDVRILKPKKGKVDRE